MEFIFLFLILTPILAFFIVSLLPSHNEKNIYRVVLGAVSTHTFLSIGLFVYWLFGQCKAIEYSGIEVYSTSTASFHIQFWFDATSACFGIVGSVISLLIAYYSTSYMYKENGYKRFFCSILFFIIGFNIVVYSGNFETLFCGWEILGVSSFLLIAFYRERYLPIKNAMKVFFFYRIADIGIILVMWISHHIFEQNISFHRLSDFVVVNRILNQHVLMTFFISGIIMFSAMIKSAQLPFSFWLSRAMEGPTPSSAIFYGSLSVHIGVFLLLRTLPIWEHQIVIKIIMAIVGVSTSIIATQISKVQSSVKSKIAYMSIAQIGVMFIMISLIGTIPYMRYVVLFHFTGNALLRTYQLLISPSSVSSLIKYQYFNKIKVGYAPVFKNQKWHNTLYLLSLKEWNLELITFKYFWQPLKLLGRMFGFLNLNLVLMITLPLLCLGIMINTNRLILPHELKELAPYFFQIIALCLTLRAFAERYSVKNSLILLMLYPMFNIVSISISSRFIYKDVLLYIVSVFVFGFVALYLLQSLEKKTKTLSLNSFWGLAERYKNYNILFLICILGLMGFPASPIFLAVDVIFSHIENNQWLLLYFAATSFSVNALALIRIYSKLFMGEPKVLNL